jgi:hypothetical protein
MPHVDSNQKTRRSALTLAPGIVLAAGLLSSCAVPTPTIQETVGPMSGARLGASRTPGEGYLEVRTRTRVVDDGGITYEPHTAYTVYTPDGHLVKGVRNHAGSDDPRPMVVRLAEGRYVIYGEAAGAGRVGIPVLVVHGQITEVNLQPLGLKLPPELPASEAVYLPDGRVIGRRAEDAPATGGTEH